MKKVLYVASEAVPFIKTGGLADVVGSLPKCFPKEYFDVRVVIPKYACMKQEFKDRLHYITHFYMDLNWRQQYVGIFEMEYEGIKFYFIDNEELFQRGQAICDGMPGDLEKFAFFSKAALSHSSGDRFQTGHHPLSRLADRTDPGISERTVSRESDFYRGIKSVMTIHNLKFQGVWDIKTVQRYYRSV